MSRGSDGPERDARTGRSSAAQRVTDQTRWVELQIRRAIERGEFDDLPGAGKPLGDLGSPHDRDWWVKKLIEREQLTGLGPPAITLRLEDAAMEQTLDRETSEVVVRRTLEDFNRRVVEARRQLQGGPPVVTPTRDVDAEVESWRRRQRARRQAQAAQLAEEQAPRERRRTKPRRRWLRRH